MASQRFRSTGLRQPHIRGMASGPASEAAEFIPRFRVSGFQFLRRTEATGGIESADRFRRMAK